MTTPATSPIPPEQDPPADLGADSEVPAIDTSPLEAASDLEMTTNAISTPDTTALASSSLDPAASDASTTGATLPAAGATFPLASPTFPPSPAGGTVPPPPPAGPTVAHQTPADTALSLPPLGQPYQTPPPPSGTPTYTSDPGAGGFAPPYAGPTAGPDPNRAGRMPWQAPRPRQGRMIAGVCAGLARRYNLSPTAVRLLFVVSTFLPGPQFVAYIVLWALMPEE